MTRKRAEQPHESTEAAPLTEPQPDATVPAVEAFAQAIAMTTHQHLAATPEDAPADPEQLNLLPRPPFDHRAALLEIAEKAAEVTELSRHMESTQAAYKRAREDWTEGAKELQSLIDSTTKRMRDSEREPEPHQLSLEGEGCAWEREHPGEVCMVCSQARAALRPTTEQPASDEAEAVRADAAAVN